MKSYVKDALGKKHRLREDSEIIFKEEEVEHLDPNHYNVLVVSVKIQNALVK